ncbi:MAG TPA: hypothetical protein VGO45_01345 [Bacteroidia bacterium]|nr:hypothetical protein [Bacteroidia bacterium]
MGVSVIMTPPCSPFVSDYYSLGSTAFQAYVTLNDLNEPFWNVRLIVHIEGQGIVLETKRSYIPPQPINLISGVPLLIEGADFAPYLDVNHLDVRGISVASLNQRGKLPEGGYQFCVEVLDYHTGVSLSYRTCGSAFIFYENPPVLLAPASGVSIHPTEPQNIYFNWQMTGGSSNTVTATSLYKLFVYELQDENADPKFAVQNNKALLIYESDYQQSTSQTIDFGLSNGVSLTPGKRYIYRVRALDANMKNIYKDDGYSEYAWFFYGYPGNGVLTANAPANAHIFTKTENKTFSWSVSNKAIAGQQFDYVLVIKEKNPGQTKEQAMSANTEWFSVNLPTTTSLNGGDYILTKDFDSGKNYVWQVKALTGAQQVAQSPVNEFYAPSVIDQFMAGNFPVKIVALTNYTNTGTTYSNVKGKGRIQLSSDPTDLVDADFTGITIEDMGSMLMTQGSFTVDLSSRPAKELQPVLPENGPALFYPSSGTINTTGLKIKGRIDWPFPHATDSSQIQYVRSKTVVFGLNSTYQLSGSATIQAAKAYKLLEPHNVVVNLDETTQINLFNDKYSLKLNGNILTNPDVRTNNGSPYSISINQQPQLNYFTASNLLITSSNFLSPIQGFNFGVMPQSAIVDLSDEVSPDKFSTNGSWKGIYFPQFQVRLFQSQFDASNQIILPGNIDFYEDQTLSDCWIANDGLQFRYQFNSSNTGIYFNKFKTAIQGNISIKDNVVSSSTLTGSIKIPAVNETDLFAFTIPVTNHGLQLGYLNEDITLRKIVFNPFGGENRVNITINRAVFANNERIDLEINAELVGFSATLKNLSDFRIYGDNVIGIGGRNGSKKLDTRVSGTYKGFNAYITDAGAALYNGSYVFSYISEMDLGEDVSGKTGPPLLSVSSVSPVGSSVELPTYSVTSPQPPPAIPVPSTPDVAASQTITSVDMYVNVTNSVVDIHGYLSLKSNDPVWGNSFSGGINGKIKVPTEIEAGANMILGTRDGVKFWYFDAWFNDLKGQGLKVTPGTNLFNITAFEGRIFHHMSKSQGQFTVDPTMAFGGALFLQLIDPSGGKLFAADIGAELKVFESGDFTINMKGDVAVLNKNSRPPGTGGTVSAVGDAVVNQVAQSLGPLSLTVDVGGGSLTVSANSLKAGSLKFTKSDYTIGVSADVTSSPKVGFNFSKGTTNFSIDAAASGQFGLGIGLGSDHVNLGLSGSNGGYLNLSIGGASLAADINRSNKTGHFSFAYDGKEVGIGVGPSSGDLSLKLSPTRIFTAGYNSSGSASIGLQFDNNSFKLSGDKTTKSGSLGITMSDLQLTLAGNASEKSASLLLSTSGVNVNISGKKGVGGTFKVATSDISIALSADLPSKTGSLGFSYDGGNKAFNASLDGSSVGTLGFKNGSQTFQIGGNTSGTAGNVSYKDGNNSFSLAADRTAGTGSLGLKIGTDSVSASVAPDSSFVAFKLNSLSFGAGYKPSGAGGLNFSDGTNSFGIRGNPTAKSGSCDLLYAGNHIALSTDLPNKNHSILVEAGGVKFTGISRSDKVQLSLEAQNHIVTIAKNTSAAAGGGLAGSVSYADGTNSFALSADPGAGTGNISLDLNGNSAKSSISSDSSSVSLNYDGYAFSSGLSSGGKGYVSYSQPNNSFKLIGNPSAQSGSIDVVSGTNHIAFTGDIPNKTYSTNIQSSGVQFTASTSPTNKLLDVAYSGYDVYANKHSSDYEVGLSINSRKIEGGLKGSVKRISYTGDGVAVGISNTKLSLAVNNQTLEITSSGVLVNGSSVSSFVAGADATFTQQLGSVSATINLKSGVYSLVFANAGNQFNITTSDFTNGSLGMTMDGNTIALTRANDKYSLTVNDYEASYEPGIVTLQKGTDKSLKVSGDNLSIAYDGKTVSVSPTAISYADGQNSCSLSSAGLSLKRNDNELFVSSTNFGLKMGTGKSLMLTRSSIDLAYDKFAASYTSGAAISASYDNYTIGYSAQNITLSQGANRSLQVSPSSLSATFDGYAFSASSTAFTYSDGTNSAGISETGISFARGENSLYIKPAGFGLDLGTTKHVYLTKNSLDVKYNNYEAAFSASKSLSFTDGTRSFALSNTGLSMSDGSKSMKLIDDAGKPAIELDNGSDKFALSQSGFAVDYGGKHYAINQTEFIRVDIDAQRHIELMNDGVKYLDGTYQFILGGGTNYVELTDGTRSIALSQDDKLVMIDGAYSASLSKDLSVDFTDGTRTINLLKGDHYLTYAQAGYTFGIRGAGGSKPGIDFSDSENTFFVEGEANSDVTVGITNNQFGTISATVNSAKDIKAKLSSGASSAYGFAVANGKLELINGSDAPPQPQGLTGTPTIPAQDGPAHLTNSISDEAGGSIKGTVNIFFDSHNKRFLMNAAVAGSNPVCIKGAMALDISPGQFNLDIGTEQQRIEIFPTCSGFGGGGWLGIHNTNVNLGVFVGWKASASVKIGSDILGARLNAYAGAELGIKASLVLDPFKINSAGVWVSLYAGISADYWYPTGSGSITIAEASLKGTLNIYFEDKTRVTGSLDGSITVLDIISASFSMGFDTTI